MSTLTDAQRSQTVEAAKALFGNTAKKLFDDEPVRICLEAHCGIYLAFTAEAPQTDGQKPTAVYEGLEGFTAALRDGSYQVEAQVNIDRFAPPLTPSSA